LDGLQQVVSRVGGHREVAAAHVGLQVLGRVDQASSGREEEFAGEAGASYVVALVDESREVARASLERAEGRVDVEADSLALLGFNGCGDHLAQGVE
jgi:hypothetical protein